MALGDVIARLAVSLSLNTVAFEKGADKSEKRMNQMRREFANTAKKFAVGAAAIGAAAGVVVSTFRDMGQQAVNSAKQIEDLSNVANASTDEFQKAAFAAKSVGIESEKLADIYKDVNDKIGDFVATGGGAMADFFENVAPKVGVTADSFRELSGPAALQLYVSSLEKANLNQQEMTFYMEAIASDATALLPLLKNNGQAMGEFADEADRLGLVMSSEEIAKAKEVASNLALINAEIEAKQNKQIIENADAYLKLEESIGKLKLAAVKFVAGAQDFTDSLDGMVDNAGNAFREMMADLDSNLKRMYASINNFVPNAVNTFRLLYVGVKTWMQDKLGAVFDWVNKKVQKVEQTFAWLYNEVVGNSWIPDMVEEVGQHMSKLQGLMVDPAVKAARDTDAAFRALARDVSVILDRLFPKMAALRDMRADAARLDEAVGAGILSPEVAGQAKRELGYEYRGGRAEPSASTIDAGPTIDFDKVKESMGDFGGVLKDTADKAKTQTVRIAESFKDMAQKTLQSFSGLVDAIKGGGFLDILESAVGLFLNLAGSGVFGSGMAGRVNGYATGTSSAARGWAWVGERGPELVNFSGGERVMNHRDSMNAGRGSVDVRVGIDPRNGNVTAYVDGRVAAHAPSIAQGGAQLAGQQAQFQRSRRLA